MACRRIYLPPNGGDNWCQRDIFAAYRKCLIDSCRSLAGGRFARFKVVIWLISPSRKIPHARRRPLLQVLLKSLQSNFYRWCACTRVLIRSRPPLPSLPRLREKNSVATSGTRFCRHEFGYVFLTISLWYQKGNSNCKVKTSFEKNLWLVEPFGWVR